MAQWFASQTKSPAGAKLRSAGVESRRASLRSVGAMLARFATTGVDRGAGTPRRYAHSLVLVLCICSPVHAYPDKAIRWIVPIAPGGTNDIVARAIAQQLAGRLQQSVVVDNRAGGGGIVGSEIAARAAADGYTLLMVNISHALHPAAQARLPYDVRREFAPITLIGSAPNVLVVHPSSAAGSVSELVAQAKRAPGKLSYASAGNASSPHLATELFKLRAGIDVVHIPYKGSAPGLVALMAAEVELAFPVLSTALPLLRAGRIRAIAVSSGARAPALPQTPTIREAGLAGYEFSAWFGCMVPAATPATIVARLNREMRAILDEGELRRQFSSQGLDLAGSAPEALARHLLDEIEKWREVIRVAGIALN